MPAQADRVICDTRQDDYMGKLYLREYLLLQWGWGSAVVMFVVGRGRRADIPRGNHCRQRRWIRAFSNKPG